MDNNLYLFCAKSLKETQENISKNWNERILTFWDISFDKRSIN